MDHLVTYLQRHGVGFETLPNERIAIHTAPGKDPVVVEVTAHYHGGDSANTKDRTVLVTTFVGVLVGIELTPAAVRRRVSGERSATQHLYNVGHDVIKGWEAHLSGVSA